ncbi:hypothetical protein B0H14DRAFT_2581957 [Mycena olivaceomarginata]|nr:hypothetical protein B0H14DRAFT_2581957 [Mycena olivaceomarginata]
MARKTATREEEEEKGWMPKFCFPSHKFADFLPSSAICSHLSADFPQLRYEFESDEQESIYLYRMTRLDGAVFPNPTMSWASRFKANVIEDLDAIANKITDSACPFTRLLHSADEYMTAEKIPEMVEENAGKGPKWLLQELNLFLRIFGELRGFCVGRKVIGVVATTPTHEGTNGLDFEDQVIVELFERSGGSRVVAYLDELHPDLFALVSEPETIVFRFS